MPEISNAKAAAMRSLAVDAVTCEVVAALRGAGIEPVLLKGPTTAAWLYADEPRDYVDTDLLVSPSAQPAAARILSGLGFTYLETGATPDERDDHSRTYVREGCEVDLHFTLTGVHVDVENAWALLTRSLGTIPVGGIDMLTLDSAARTLHIVLHAADSGGRGSRTKRDLLRAIERTDSETWRAAADLARDLNALAAFEAGLRQLPEGEQVLSALGIADAATAYEYLRAENSTPGALRLARLLSARPGERPREMMRVLMPSPAYMRSWSRLARYGPPGLVLAYLVRPLYLAAHAVPALAAHNRARRIMRRES